MTYLFSRQAVADIDAIQKRIADHDPAAALRVVDAIEATSQTLSRTPRIGRVVASRFEGLRVLSVRGSPRYLLFHQVVDDDVLVVRVLHSARDIDALIGPDTGS